MQALSQLSYSPGKEGVYSRELVAGVKPVFLIFPENIPEKSSIPDTNPVSLTRAQNVTNAPCRRNHFL